ncbi:protein inscuteable homolog [Brevipalpus obovatus]|uniref:protein inscuteable homolog n=1 Tax=Brevipalpus obovatus TaxID=246614 RepID=UPI003D9E3523
MVKFVEKEVNSNDFSVPSDDFCNERIIKNRRNSRHGIPTNLQNIAKKNSSLAQWLKEIRKTTDVECLNALHAKEIAETTDQKQALAVRSAQVSIRKIRDSSIEIIDDIEVLIDWIPLELSRLQKFEKDFSLVFENIHSAIRTFRESACDQAEILINELFTVSASIKLLLKEYGLKKIVSNPSLKSQLEKIKELFGKLVDIIIKRKCQMIFSGLYAPIEGICLKWTLLALKSITNGDAYICRIFSENDSLIRKLIELLSSHLKVSERHSPTMLRTTALRILYYLCVNPEAIQLIYRNIDMEKHITLVLQNERNESVLREIAGLLVPLTTPFIDYKRTYQTDKALSNFISNRDDLVVSLVRVLSTTSSVEVFLLSTWSLANISFYDPKLMIKDDVLAILVAKTRRGGIFGDDIAVKDQVLTIIANISSISPLEIVRSSGLVYLISAIQIRPVVAIRDEGELEIIQRMQKKVSTALTRLAVNQRIASLIYRHRGCHRLVQICKDPKERNYSEAVLVAALIAFRRIYSVLKTIPLEEMDAEDLIQLPFEEALQKYSYSNESHA